MTIALVLLLPITVTTPELIVAMVVTIGIAGTVYNYWQDKHMKTKHTQSLVTRLLNTKSRKTELEKFKEFGEDSE